jgi:hypothetical protein
MSTISQRVSKLERTVRRQAFIQLDAEISAEFEPIIAKAANDPKHIQRAKDLRADMIKARRASAESKALEDFLKRSQPSVSILDCLRPQMFRLGADGKRMAEDAPGEHIAVLIPNYAPGKDLLIDARAPAPCDSLKDAEKKVAALELLGDKIDLLDDLQWSLILDRRFRNPSLNPVFFPKSPTDRWYYTKTPLVAEKGKSPSGCVWAVRLDDGSVGYFYPLNLGFVRGGRLVPASQY